MNYFRRRSILKKANFLELIPVRVLGHTVCDNGGVRLLMPRFRNRFSARLFQPRSKDGFIRIRLDRFGSRVWELTDGRSSVGEITERLCERFPAELPPGDETIERVTGFFSMLYQQRYISFREIMDENGSERQINREELR